MVCCKPIRYQVMCCVTLLMICVRIVGVFQHMRMGIYRIILNSKFEFELTMVYPTQFEILNSKFEFELTHVYPSQFKFKM